MSNLANFYIFSCNTPGSLKSQASTGAGGLPGGDGGQVSIVIKATLCPSVCPSVPVYRAEILCHKRNCLPKGSFYSLYNTTISYSVLPHPEGTKSRKTKLVFILVYILLSLQASVRVSMVISLVGSIVFLLV